MSTKDYVLENAELELARWGQVVRGHDAVHPERDACGGVGNCKLMMAEHEAEQEALDVLRRLARRNAVYNLKVTR